MNEQLPPRSTEDMEKKDAKKTKKLFFIIPILLLILNLVLIYLIYFSNRCNNLEYLYSNLQKCNNTIVSLKGVAFTDSIDYPEQGNPFYMEKNGYLIDVRGLTNVKTGEMITVKGKVITSPIVFIETSESKRGRIVRDYEKEEICRKRSIRLDTLEMFEAPGRLFTVNLTLLNFSVSLVKNKFVKKGEAELSTLSIEEFINLR